MEQKLSLERMWLLAGLVVVAAFVWFAPDAAWAAGDGLDKLADKAKSLESNVKLIMRSLFIIAGMIVAYAWAKGDHEARAKTEKLFIGLAVAYGIGELVTSFGL